MGTATRATTALGWVARLGDLLPTDRLVLDCGRLTAGKPVLVCGVVGVERHEVA